ncbi:MAG: retropepsin-like aspartic protease, partial [Planctomycetota bacterium]
AERRESGTGPVRIPMRIEHGKLHVTGRINGSSELDLIFDTGASVCVLYPSGLEKGASFHGDLTVNNNVESRRQLDLDGEVEVVGLRWHDEPVLFVEKQVDQADGILGYTVFEDKVLEFDYGRGELVVHETLEDRAAGFTSVPMSYVYGLTEVEVGFVDADWEERGAFLLDTGANAALLATSGRLPSALNARLERLGSGTASGVGPRTTQHAFLRAPELFFAGQRFENVGVHASLEALAESDDPQSGVVGMELLRRFDAFLDYPRARAYFRPNADFARPFGSTKKSSFPWPLALALLGAGAVLLVRRQRRSRRAA